MLDYVQPDNRDWSLLLACSSLSHADPGYWIVQKQSVGADTDIRHLKPAFLHHYPCRGEADDLRDNGT